MSNFEDKIIDISFADKVDEYLLHKKINGISNETLTTYKAHLNNIGITPEQLFDEIDWEKVIYGVYNRTNIRDYTKRSYLKSLKTFLIWAGVDIKFSISKVETMKETYTDEELKKLVAKPKKPTFSELRTWTLILLALDTGLRSASIRNIRIGDIRENTVAIRHSKTRKVRIIPFSHSTQSAINMFLRHREGSEDDFLFCDIYGNQMTADGLKHAVLRYNRSRGVQKTSMHMFRHTFAKKFLLDCGGNAFTLQKMLMHSTMEMTQQYCNIFDADLINNYKSPLESLSKKKIRMKQ